MKYINSKKVDGIKLMKGNFYVLMDFDRTLTKGDSISCWRVLYYSDLLGDDFKQRYDEIHDKHSETWEDRFKEYINLLHEKKLDNEMIKGAVRKTNLQLRDGAKEFLKKMNDMNVPVIIMSCSIRNVIKEYLKANDCDYNNIYIYSNYCDIERKGERDIYSVTPHSKNRITFSKELNDMIVTKEYTLLFGDVVDDINMATKERKENTITVGFLDKKIEENLALYQSAFDIVLTNNASFKEVEDIIK
ncbi:MAG: hypothetical protein HFJ35_05910 [Clostridia bacterium]|nr:hypothetical protein [Clostridia bacterium]